MVSGNRRLTRPPPTSTDEAIRMGIAFVMPTRDPKIRFPSTADSLHRALQNPKPVPLRDKNKDQGQSQVSGSTFISNKCRRKRSLWVLTSWRWGTTRSWPHPESSRLRCSGRCKGTTWRSSWTHWCRTTRRSNWCLKGSWSHLMGVQSS